MKLEMEELNPSNFDSALSENKGKVVGVFFWGNDCPNCEVAKRALASHRDRWLALPIHWYQVNTYEHMDLGVRFGLYGIPTFLFFKDGQKLGRICPFPGIEPFLAAIESLK